MVKPFALPSAGVGEEIVVRVGIPVCKKQAEVELAECGVDFIPPSWEILLPLPPNTLFRFHCLQDTSCSRSIRRSAEDTEVRLNSEPPLFRSALVPIKNERAVI